MGLIADSVIAQMRQKYGRDYHWTEWEQCADDLGLSVAEIVGLEAPAYLFGPWIIVRAGLTPYIRAWWGWEEIGHHLTACGSREHWRRCLPGLQGELNVARFERAAHDVRLRLPAWESAGDFS